MRFTLIILEPASGCSQATTRHLPTYRTAAPQGALRPRTEGRHEMSPRTARLRHRSVPNRTHAKAPAPPAPAPGRRFPGRPRHALASPAAGHTCCQASAVWCDGWDKCSCAACPARPSLRQGPAKRHRGPAARAPLAGRPVARRVEPQAGVSACAGTRRNALHAPHAAHAPISSNACARGRRTRGPRTRGPRTRDPRARAVRRVGPLSRPHAPSSPPSPPRVTLSRHPALHARRPLTRAALRTRLAAQHALHACAQRLLRPTSVLHCHCDFGPTHDVRSTLTRPRRPHWRRKSRFHARASPRLPTNQTAWDTICHVRPAHREQPTHHQPRNASPHTAHTHRIVHTSRPAAPVSRP